MAQIAEITHDGTTLQLDTQTFFGLFNQLFAGIEAYPEARDFGFIVTGNHVEIGVVERLSTLEDWEERFIQVASETFPNPTCFTVEQFRHIFNTLLFYNAKIPDGKLYFSVHEGRWNVGAVSDTWIKEHQN